MSNTNISLESTIKSIEDFYFGKNEDSGINLFSEFACQHEKTFINSNISNSTENKFE